MEKQVSGPLSLDIKNISFWVYVEQKQRTEGKF